MWPALIIRSSSLKFLLLSLVLAQRQISSLLNIIFSYKSFLHLCCNVKIPRLATPCCIFRDVTRMSYMLLLFPIAMAYLGMGNFCHRPRHQSRATSVLSICQNKVLQWITSILYNFRMKILSRSIWIRSNFSIYDVYTIQRLAYHGASLFI